MPDSSGPDRLLSHLGWDFPTVYTEKTVAQTFGRVFSTPILSLLLPSWVTLGSDNCLAPSGSTYASAQYTALPQPSHPEGNVITGSYLSHWAVGVGEAPTPTRRLGLGHENPVGVPPTLVSVSGL